jgi:L-ascorbate metabolism protein UlaG (beta-lactamase superfamily)
MSSVSHEPDLHYLGHSTFRIELGGLRILTDPTLRPIIGPLARSGPLPTVDDYRDIDLILISHLHHDHLDLPSLRLVSGQPTIVAPRGSADLLRRNHHRRVVELVAGESTRIGDLTIEAIRADHPGQRPPFGPTAPALGYLLTTDRKRLYFAGDTEVFKAMRRLDRPDIALLPVGGWGPTHGPGHMDPGEAAEATRLIRPRVVVPMHWGTFWPRGLGFMTPERRHGAAALFRRHAAELTPDAAVRIALPGEHVRLGRGD